MDTQIQQIPVVIFKWSSCLGHRTVLMAGVGMGCEAQEKKHIG